MAVYYLLIDDAKAGFNPWPFVSRSSDAGSHHFKNKASLVTENLFF